jgi:hypothetical protein
MHVSGCTSNPRAELLCRLGLAMLVVRFVAAYPVSWFARQCSFASAGSSMKVRARSRALAAEAGGQSHAILPPSIFLATLLLVGGTAGCAVGGSRLTVMPEGKGGVVYPIAVHYDVEALYEGPLDEEVVARIGADFRMLAELGFDHIVLEGVAGAKGRELLVSAREAGLGVIESDGLRLNRLGCDPQMKSEGGLAPSDEIRATTDLRLRGGKDQPGGITLSRGRISAGGYPVDPFERLAPAGVCVTLRNPVVVWGSVMAHHSGPAVRGAMPSHRAPLLGAVVNEKITAKLASDPDQGARVMADDWVGRGPAIVDASALAVPKEESPLQHLLNQYHAAVSLGRTNGLIVAGGRCGSVEGGGLLNGRDPPTARQRTAIEALLGRARYWRPRIAGLSAERVSPVGTPPEAVSATLLYGEHVRYVMIHNSSLAQYARGRVRLPARMQGDVDRAVEVRAPFGSAPQGLADQSPGRVIKAQQGELVLPIELRPGDATLFELF